MQSAVSEVKPTVVVAMSGGVDSSVAAHLLSRQGYEVTGVSMQVWDYRKNEATTSRASCCSPADFCDARRVAAKLDMPFYVVDFEETFQREVIERFVRTYEEGMTPNPCIDCNSRVKFRELRQRAKAFGCDVVATGHYARIRRSDAGYHLLRGKDSDKDQSYFLYTCKQEELASTMFPVGDLTKAEVRELAREAGLATADKKESQDICFVSGSVQDFVKSIGRGGRSGVIRTKDGTVVGEHDSITRFTVGQRRGLGIGGTEEPLYVVELNSENGDVVVGNRDDLRRESFAVRELSLVSPSLLQRTAPYSFESVVQVRSRHRGVHAVVDVGEGGNAVVRFKDEWAPVSPGQAAVFYDSENVEVLGGGRIVGAVK